MPIFKTPQRTLLVADIFGKTPALEELAQALDGDIDIIDPYQGKYMAFSSEAEAYQYFSQNVTVGGYQQILEGVIEKVTSPTRVVAFSVGGSAFWSLSGSLSNRNISFGVCFYSSQIRYAVSVNPKLPIQLYFPLQEEHFSVDDLILALAGKDLVSIEQTQYLHGFMNKYSKQFNQQAYQEFIGQLNQSEYE